MLTLGQAAKLAGVGMTTLTRAIRAGRLSATRRDDGGYAIDPSELSRVYRVTPETVAATVSTARRTTPEETPASGLDLELATRLALPEAELRAMKDLLAEIRQSRDAWLALAERLALAPPPAWPGPNQRRPWLRRLAG